MSKYKKYPSYKDSNTDWLNTVPNKWSVVRNKQAFNFIKDLVGKKSKEYTLLSLTLKGIKVRDIESGKGKFPAEFDTYQKVEENNLIFCLFDIDETPRTIGISSFKGMITGAYNVARCNDSTVPKYIYYYYLSVDEYKGLKPFYTGLRKVVRTETFMNIPIALPSFKEQQTIANYLDTATAKIDTLIQKQTKLIELLKEKRQAVISHAVTRGLDSSVPMKDSGVEWLGEIPKRWLLSKLRYVFSFSKGLTITKANLEDKGIPCVNYGEIHSKYGFEVDAIKHNLKCVNESYLKDSASSLLSLGDFVFADTSEDLEGAGNFTHVVSNAKIFAGYHTVIAKQVNNHDFRFLAYLIDSVAFRTQIQLAVKGVKVFSITQAILRDSIAWLPELQEQEAIANYLDDKTSKIDNLVGKATKAIELLKEKRTALISSVVTGKIDVRETA